MRARVITALAIVSAATSLAGWQVASASGSPDDRDGHTIRLEEDSSDDTGAMVDLGEPGVTVGDYFPILDSLFRPGGNEPIGRTSGNCMILEAHPETHTSIQECWFTFDLPSGSIAAQGPMDFSEPGPYELAVTGGTGNYRAAHGTLSVGDGARGVTFTFELR